MSSRPIKRLITLVAAGGSALAALAFEEPTATQPLGRDIRSQRQLFVDDFLLDRLDGVRLEPHPPVPREVVFRFDAPWEGRESGYVTVLQDGQRFRMYYRGGGELSREQTCLAESDDGIHWTRPNLGLFEFNGSRENNIVWMPQEKSYQASHNFTPFLDANPAALPDQRYKAVALGRTGEGEERSKALMIFASPDGVYWRPMRDEAVISGGGFDSQTVAFWDVIRQEYVWFFRAGRDGFRSIRRCTSPDFLNWSESQWLDFGNTPLEHLYTNAILTYFRAPHLYLGFPQRFVPDRKTIGPDNRPIDGVSDGVFMSSHDGLHWHRTFMEAFVRPGLDPQNWGGAHGNNCPAWGMLQTSENELSIYWSEHFGNWPDDRTTVPQLRRGTLRLDGFVSLHAGYAGGEAVTKPLRFEGGRLVINFATSAVGSVKVELQDADGKAIPGFALTDAVELYGDELARTVSWKNGTDLKSLADRPIRLRFVLKDADVYSMQFRP